MIKAKRIGMATVLALIVVVLGAWIWGFGDNAEAGDTTTTTAAPTTTAALAEASATTASAPTTTTKVDEPWLTVCDDVDGEYPFYFSQVPGIRTGYFGPAVKAESVEEALSELHATMCRDPFITASVVEAYNGNLSDTATITAVKEYYLQDRSAWLRNVAWVEGLLSGKKVLPDKQTYAVAVEIVDLKVSEAWTQIAILRPGQSPLVDWEKEFKGRYHALRTEFSDGAWVDLQLDCHFQPTLFVKGTKRVVVTTTTTTRPTTTTSTTHPTTTTSTTHPTTTTSTTHPTTTTSTTHPTTTTSTTHPTTTTSTTTTHPTTTTSTTHPTTTTSTTHPTTTTSTTTTHPTTTTSTTHPTTTTTTIPVVYDFKPQLVGPAAGPWTLTLQSQSGEFSSFAPAIGSVITESMLYKDPATGDKWLWVTGYPADGSAAITRKSNTVVFGY